MNAALANHLLQSTIFALVAGILTLLLRNNHARMRYWVWLTASMKFLVPFSLFVEIGHRLSWSNAPIVVQPRVALVMDAVSQPFTVPETFAVSPAGAASAPSIVPILLLGAWICGCVAVLIFWSEGILRVCRFYLVLPLTCASGICGSDIGERIERIMQSPLLRSLNITRKIVFGCVGLLALIVPVVAGMRSVSVGRSQLPSRAGNSSQAGPRSEMVTAPDLLPKLMAQLAPKASTAPVAQMPVDAASHKEFEVASMRPAWGRGSRTGGPGTDDPGRISYEGITLRSLLMIAYGLKVDQISGPAWIDSEFYAIAAKMPEGTTQDEFQAMMRNLLVDRLGLAVHRESRASVGYELVLAKGGPKLKDSASAPNASSRYLPQFLRMDELPVSRDGFYVLGERKGTAMRMVNGAYFCSYQNVSMENFVQHLGQLMGSPVGQNRLASANVVNNTGLTGEYDFTLEYGVASAPMPRFNGGRASEPGDPAGDAGGDGGSDFYAALEKQLGLRLLKTKTTADVLVVDHVEKVPTAN